jgi:F-type H+-transporting ATPase subunit b
MTDPASAATTAAADSSASGLPQFDLAQWPGEMVWVLGIFLVLFLLFQFVFVPAVGGTIDAREDKISGDIGDARRLRDEAQAQAAAAAGEMGEARARAHKVASEARDAAKAAAAARQGEEDAKLAARLSEAEQRIAAARGEAMGHVRAIAAETAGAIIERLTGAAASEAELDAALGAEG